MASAATSAGSAGRSIANAGGAPVDIDQRRAGYDFFRAIFLQDISPGLLRELAAKLPSGELSPEGGPRWSARLTGALRFDRDDEIGRAADEMRWEFNRLFVGPRKPVAPPYESAYQSPDGLLLQAPCDAVRHIYGVWGLDIDRARGMADDYIGYELEFMYFLLSLECGTADTAPRDVERLHAAQREFLNEHIISWVPPFCADIVSGTRLPLWRELAGALLDFVYSETRAGSADGNRANSSSGR